MMPSNLDVGDALAESLNVISSDKETVRSSVRQHIMKSDCETIPETPNVTSSEFCDISLDESTNFISYQKEPIIISNRPNSWEKNSLNINEPSHGTSERHNTSFHGTLPNTNDSITNVGFKSIFNIGGMKDMGVVVELDDSLEVVGLDESVDVIGLDESVDVVGSDESMNVGGLVDSVHVGGVGDNIEFEYMLEVVGSEVESTDYEVLAYGPTDDKVEWTKL
ncbi:hypothetical protein Bhyg_12286 [Pseudolycoriella hygida]|uniref:Uncharacterized protein n=1 Tax=Pseudolycoriella hygida TaxID=35572 RepID=A0A9Q0RZ57_9DIPT|nr:hypothetical protein Bhyg_12286 [Pseudolycoriella hygida]